MVGDIIEGGVADEALVRALQEKIAKLEDSKGIMLQQMDDKTLVNLPDAILFPSGSDDLTNSGVETQQDKQCTWGISQSYYCC